MKKYDGDPASIDCSVLTRRGFVVGSLATIATLVAACGSKPAKPNAASNPEANLSVGRIHDRPEDVRGIFGFGHNRDIAQVADPGGAYEEVAGEPVILWLRRGDRPAVEAVDVPVTDSPSAEALGIAGATGGGLALDGLHFSANRFDAQVLAQNPGTGGTEVRDYTDVYELAGPIVSLQGTLREDPGAERLEILSRLNDTAAEGSWAVGIRIYPNFEHTITIINKKAAVVVTHVIGQPGNESLDERYLAQLHSLGAGFDLSVPAAG